MLRREQEVTLKTIPEVTQEVVLEVMKIMKLPMEMEGQVRRNVEINLNFLFFFLILTCLWRNEVCTLNKK